MSSHLRAKELLMLLPILGLMGVAFYRTQTGTSSLGGWNPFESVLGANGAFVESVQLNTASGPEREKGFSHTLTVTLNHPPGWKHCCGGYRVFDAFDKPLPTKRLVQDSSSPYYATEMDEVIWKHDGKLVLLGQKNTKRDYGDFENDLGRLVFTRNLTLQKAGAQGEVEFHGLYIISGHPAIEVHQVLRGSDERLTFDTSKDTHGRVLSVEPKSWQVERIEPSQTSEFESPDPPYNLDFIQLNFRIQCAQIGTNDEEPQIDVYDAELIDGNGRIYQPKEETYWGSSIGNSWWLSSQDKEGGKESPERVSDKGNPANEYRLAQYIYFDSGFRPRKPLTLQGKISINHQWPMTFSVKLPSRH